MHIQRQADSFAYRMAASLPTEDELSGLQKEFDDWWDAIPEEKRPRPDGNCAWNFNNSPITSWENVEKFLSEHYPQAHSGAEWSEDAIGSAMGKNYPDYVRPVSDQRTLANMIMLHRRSQGLGLPNRGAWTPDEAALYSTPGMAEAIVKGRNKMQRDYEQRNMVHANTIRCAVDDYRGYHRGPDAEYGSSMDNPDGVFPDIDTHPEYYDTYQPYDYESHHQIRRVRGKPDAWVTVYRALPFSVIQNKTYRGGPNDLYEGSKPYRYRQREAPINTNDWVTPSYSYAKEHGESNLSNEPWTIVQQRVRARSLFSEGNSIHEWAYNGEPIVGTEGDRARRERGLRTRKTKRSNTIRCATSIPSLTDTWKDFVDWAGGNEDEAYVGAQWWPNLEQYLADRHGLSNKFQYTEDKDEYYSHPMVLQMGKIHAFAHSREDGIPDITDSEKLEAAAMGLINLRKRVDQQRQNLIDDPNSPYYYDPGEWV